MINAIIISIAPHWRTRLINRSPSPKSQHRTLWRSGEQLLLAVVVAGSLLAMVSAWALQGGLEGRLIGLDHAQPIEIPYEVDINRATWPELSQLPQIGETLARRIVESRQHEGPFRDHEDLRRVQGIGPKTLERIRPYLKPMPQARAVAGG